MSFFKVFTFVSFFYVFNVFITILTFLGDLCYRTVVLFVCLDVTLVCCGQTAGWIKMPVGTEVGLGSDDIVLDGDPAPSSPPKKRAQQPPLFGP